VLFFLHFKPKSLKEAAIKVRDWLRDGHWVQNKWIYTPNGAYADDCKACLHGAVVYLGGPYGPELSKKLNAHGYDITWNDSDDRTVEEVLEALEEIV